MKTENDGHASSNDQKRYVDCCHRFLAAASRGVGFASLIRTQDVFSMARNEGKAFHQTVSEHARSESLLEDVFDLPR